MASWKLPSNVVTIRKSGPEQKIDPRESMTVKELLEDATWDDRKTLILRRKLRDHLNHMSMEDLSNLLVCFTSKVAHLLSQVKRERLSVIVMEILQFNWSVKVFADDSEQILDSLFPFVTELLTFSVVQLKNCFRILVIPLFIGKRICEGDAAPVASEKRVFTKMHSFLKSVVDMYFPADELLIKSIEKNFPHHRVVSLHNYKNYVTNALMVSAYIRCKRRLLEVLFDKLLWLELNDNQVTSEEMFDIDLEKDQSQDLFDTCFDQLLCFIEFMFSRSKSPEEFVKNIVTVFKKLILPSTDCRHIQFMLLFLGSFSEDVLTQICDSLWSCCISPSTLSDETKHRCAYYISSLLVHAKYASPDYIIRYVDKIMKWLHVFVDQNEFDLTIPFEQTMEKYSVFHSVCQAVFFIVVAKHQEFNEDAMSSLRLMNFQRIVSSDFNPLAACLPSIRAEFAAVAKHYQLALCLSILQKNRRRNLNKISYSTSDPSYYSPFFSFKLKVSAAKIEPSYRSNLIDYFSKSSDMDSITSVNDTKDENNSFEDSSLYKSSEKLKFIEMMICSFSPKDDAFMSSFSPM